MGYTPPLFEALNREFNFTLDAAANDVNHLCDKYYTKENSGLDKSWKGETVWCNPPYGKTATGVWTKKCFEESRDPSTTVVMLIPARTDRKSFHDYIYNRPDVEVRFLPGRLKFNNFTSDPIEAAPFPSMIVIFH